MAYVHISRTPGIGLEGYQALRRSMGDAPIEGQLAHLVGVSDGALQIVDVWSSKAEADRFAAERLFPAFQTSGLRPGSDSSYTTFEADVADLTGGAR